MWRRAPVLAGLFSLVAALSAPPAGAEGFRPLEAFGRVKFDVPQGWRCGPGEGGAVACEEPGGLARLSVALVETRHERPLSEAEARRAAAAVAQMVARGEEERFGSAYYGWETVDGGAIEGGRAVERDGVTVRTFDWALLVASTESIVRVTFQLVARQPFFETPESRRLVDEIGARILEAEVR